MGADMKTAEKVKHTEGPWKRSNSTDIFTTRHPLGQGDVQIADCSVHRVILDTDVELSFEEMKANAQLMAAAPEMLAELHTLRRFISMACGESAPYARLALNRIDLLIAKAETTL